jgi:UDP-N-acetylmuramate: L-alanyl-gamma-D-glutamyl-meso-diaminopimelate ligase
MRWPGRRLRVLFEPRSNTTVTDEFSDPMLGAFREADEVWLGPIYRAERISRQKILDRQKLTKGLNASGCDAHFTDDIDEIVKHIASTGFPGDIVLILSNGAFGGIYDKFRGTAGQSPV